MCTKKFASKSSLNGHQKKKHPELNTKCTRSIHRNNMIPVANNIHKVQNVGPEHNISHN